jgi:hypothetical protein
LPNLRLEQSDDACCPGWDESDSPQRKRRRRRRRKKMRTDLA